MLDLVACWHTFLEQCNHIDGITILGTLKHDFPGGGFSGLVLIGESHAAIHTWPEQQLAWVELATCGNPQTLAVFAERMQRLGTTRICE